MLGRNGKILYLPIEIKKREFLGKMLLGCFAAEKGLHVVIGRQGVLRKIWRKNPPGIYCHKDTYPTRTQKPDFVDQLAYGNRFVAIDEESLLVEDAGKYLKVRAWKGTIEALDSFYLWGEQQKEILLGRDKDIEDRLVVTGNPRIDVLSPVFRKTLFKQRDKINNRYGRIILINSSRISNRYMGGGTVKDGVLYAKRIEKYFSDEKIRAFYDYREELYDHFINAIAELCTEFPEYTIIIRPHPRERSERWLKDTASMKNVQIVSNDASALPYICASDAMIHNNCTTGIESFILDIPTVAFNPIETELWGVPIDETIPSRVSLLAKNIEQLLSWVRKAADNQGCYESQDHHLKTKFLNNYIYRPDGNYSSEIIAENISRLDIAEGAVKTGIPVTLSRVLSDAIRLAKNKAATIAMNEKHRILQKNEDITYREALETLESFQEVSGQFSHIELKRYYSNCFILSSKR